MTKLVHERAADEARGSGHEHPHRRRVYWGVCTLFAALLLAGCDHSHESAPPRAPRLSPRALDAQQQRLVADYQPVSRALTRYELALRDVQLGRLPRDELLAEARTFRGVVVASLGRVRHDEVRGATATAKALLVQALLARRAALAALAAEQRARYERRWNHSVVLARRALTKLQDIRDEARLIPLPEDSIS